MKRLAKGGLAFSLLPTVAFAHGEQVLALPIGQGAALLVIFVAAFLLRISAKQRAIFILVPVLTAPVIWFLPGIGGLVGRNFGYGATPWFVIGVGGPMFVAGFVFVVLRILSKKKAGAQPK